MALPVPTTVATGYNSAAGCCYRVATDQFLLTDSGGASNITAVTANPSYFDQVKDCPCGGTLPLMINWQAAHSGTR